MQSHKNPCSNNKIHLLLFEHGFYLTKPKLGPDLLRDITQESAATLTNHLAHAFVCEYVGGVYDIVAT